MMFFFEFWRARETPDPQIKKKNEKNQKKMKIHKKTRAPRRFCAGCVAAAPAAAPLMCCSLWTCAVSSPILRWSSTLASPIHPRITVSILVSACSIVVTRIQLSPT